jgi:hypothetical protein
VIEQVRLKSRAPDSPAWSNPIYYPEMARKVVLKRLGKYADLSPEATRAIALDNLVVGGEDWAGTEPEGISPEYRNQLVRAQTQASIERLKERMAADKAQQDPPPAEDQQAHPPLEQEVGQTEPATATPPAGTELEPEAARERAFTPGLLDEIVKDGLAPNREEAAKTLGLSPWAKMKQPLSSRRPVFQWLRDFNEFIDIGAKVPQAAKKATERWQASGSPAGEEGAEEESA